MRDAPPPLTEAEAVEAAACFHELLTRADPQALTRTIEHVLKARAVAGAPPECLRCVTCGERLATLGYCVQCAARLPRLEAP